MTLIEPTRTAPTSRLWRNFARQNTMAQRALGATVERTGALRDLLAELLMMEQPRKHIAGMISGLDVHYDLGDGHPMLGWRMPDLDLATADGLIRVFTLLHDARALLVNLGQPGACDIAPSSARDLVRRSRSRGSVKIGVAGNLRLLRQVSKMLPWLSTSRGHQDARGRSRR